MAYKIRAQSEAGGIVDETEFLSRSDRFLLFVEQNRTAVLMTLGSIILVAAIVGGLTWVERQNERDAWDLAGQAQILYLDRSLDDLDQAKKNVGEAVTLYRTVVEEFPRTDAAVTSLYLMANGLMEQGDVQGAIAAYEDFLQKHGRNAMMVGLVRQRLGYAYLANGDNEQALKQFSDVLASPGALNKDHIVFELAKLDEDGGAIEQAVSRYKELLSEYPVSPYASEATVRIQALSPEDAEPTPPTPATDEPTDNEPDTAPAEPAESSETSSAK